MTRTEITTQVTEKMGKTDQGSVDICNGFVRRRYRMIYDGSLWKDTLIVSSMAADSNVLILPQEIGLIVGIRFNETMIDPVELSFLLRTDPSAFERTGGPIRFGELQPIGMSRQPIVTDTLVFISTDANDITTNVLIRGSLAGVPQYESLTLDGLNSVLSGKSWDEIFSLTKDVTVGSLTISGFPSSTDYLLLWPNETEKKYLQIQLFDSPTELDKDILILGKKRYQDLVFDNDSPVIRGIENALIAFVEGDMLERERQYSKAQSKILEGQGMLAIAMNIGIYQSANINQLTPDDLGEWNRNDFE